MRNVPALNIPMTNAEYQAYSATLKRLPSQLAAARAKYRRYIERAKELGMLDILEPEEKGNEGTR